MPTQSPTILNPTLYMDAVRAYYIANPLRKKGPKNVFFTYTPPTPVIVPDDE